MIDEVTIKISKTVDGKGYFIQIVAEDQVSLNVAFVVEEVHLEDDRGLDGT